jgi:hypothetical protein
MTMNFLQLDSYTARDRSGKHEVREHV